MGWRKSRRRQTAQRRSAAVVSFVAVSGLAAVAQANPQGGNVVAGAATISSAGRTVTVNQTSNRAIINWQAFSIGAGETTRFNLPSSTAAILNRVTGADPSLIAGHLTSNGQVYLINPNGIVVGPNGRINTAGFVASTLNLRNDAFMQGSGMTFKGDSGAGIRVLGSITANNGDVVLIAAMVDNQGRIAAPNGQAILGAGGEVFYMPDGQSDIVIKAPAASGAGSVANSGTITAASVQMKAAGSAYALAVNNSGIVSATGIAQQGGRIVLDGGDGDVTQGGTLTASGGTVGVSGGQVTVSGTVDVSAAAGGGSIAVTARQNAAVAAAAKLKANATASGNGGSITVKAQGDATVTGSIEAKGGPQGGNGGSAEISGATLTYHGHVDLTAPFGKIGNFLIDPTDITICVLCSLTPTDIVVGLVGSDMTVQATNSITVNAAVTSSSAQTLFLDAPTTTLNAGVSLTNATLEFTNTSGTNGGALSSGSGAAIAANSIQVLGNYATVNLAGTVTAGTDLQIKQPAITATSINIANAANVIPSLVLIGGNTLSGDFTVATTGALSVTGSVQAGSINIRSFGDLTIQSNSGFGSNGVKTLASLNGTFKNLAGAALFNGTGRNRIYAATDTGYVDGGINFTAYNPVSFGNDPMSGLANVAYIKVSSQLPTLTITPDSMQRTYGGADPTFTASFAGGTNGDLAIAPTLAVSGSDVNAGNYTIQASGAISSTKSVHFATGTLTVNPAPLTITANDLTRAQGAGSPAFSTSYSGLVNGDTSAAIGGYTFFASDGFSTSPAGSYSVRPFGFGTNANYAVTYVNGTLTITAPPPPPPKTFLGPVTYLPATVTTTTVTTTVPETLKPTTLTLPAADPTITVNPLIGTPLQIFGPLAETMLDQFAASFDPPSDESTILVALNSPAIAPTIMMLLDNFMIIQLDAILKKPQSSWTADETTFVNGFLGYINAQRAAAATKAEADYEAWGKATVAAEDAKIKADTGEVQIMEMAALSTAPPIPPADLLAEASAGMVLTGSQSDMVLSQMSAGEEASEALNGTAGTAYLAYITGNSFQMGGKGVQIMTMVTKITENEKNTPEASGTLAKLKSMTLDQRTAWKKANPDEFAKLKATQTTRVVTETTSETTTDTQKAIQTTTKVLGAADTLEAVGRVVSVLGVAGEAAAIVLQTAATATQYAEQASYNDAFTAAVNKANKPLGVADLKTMMSTGEAMTYLMADMASGNPNLITASAAKPDMPLSQILNITKNF